MSQRLPTFQRLDLEQETREKIFAVNSYLREKTKQSGFVRAKVERQFRAAARLLVGNERSDRMQMEDGREVVAETHEVPKRAHYDAEFITRLTIGLGDAQLAGNRFFFVDRFVFK
jgi:hypothetical protein